jgi:EAL domain-containing protein (putative c-di-GMP-specific phosphodiesterase class I)
MLGAKVGGRGGIARLESTSDHPWTVDDLRLEDDLRNAMQSGRGLFPVFQPIVRLSDRKVVGYEALVRWQHPERGLLMPGEFIGLAEKTGLIVPLGWWMLDTVCSVFAAEKLDGWVSINVAGAQLGKGELVPTVARALEVSGLRPWQLHLEITESQLVNPTPQLLDELAMLHVLGVALALDDFGTGYSSVALLRDLNIHTIKIDFSFTSYIDTQPRIASIVKGLIAFCQQLGILVIAEGVEMLAQDELLRAFNCQFGQGFLYGHPDSLQRSGAPKDVTGGRVSPKSM